MSIGVTGDKGFIGKNLVSYLFRKGFRIETMAQHTNVESARAIEHLVKKCDYVVHLARKNKGTDEEILNTNVTGVLNVAEQCAKHSKPSLIISSDYPHKSAYRAANLTGEFLSVAINKNLGGKNSVLILPKVFGPHCKPYYNSFVSTILYSIAKGKEYEHMIDNPDTTVGLVHVNQVCREICDIIDKNEVTYASMSPEMTHTFRDIIAMAKGAGNIFSETVEWYTQNM